jgi:hypothetical protein
VEEIQQLNKIEDAKKLQACQNDQNPLYNSAAGSGRVVGAPSHGTCWSKLADQAHAFIFERLAELKNKESE